MWKTDPLPQRGFSLIELLIVVVLVGLIAALAVPSYEKAVEAARVARATGDIHAIEKDLLAYDALTGHLPADLAAIGRADLLDPWQRPYVYLNFFVDPSPNGSGGNGHGGNGQGGTAGIGGNENGRPGESGGGGKGAANADQVSVQVQGLMRRDRNLVPLNSRFDLYSKGKDGQSQPPITAQSSWDDIIRANDGSFVGLASNY